MMVSDDSEDVVITFLNIAYLENMYHIFLCVFAEVPLNLSKRT